MTSPTKRAPKIDLNPSAAERWTTCTASPKFIFDNWDKVPVQDTIFNQEGTSAHEVAAAFLQDRQPNPANCPMPVDKEMRWHGWNYAEYVQSLLKPGGFLQVEQKIPLFYMEGRNAIVDVAVKNPEELHIVDFKYGAGITVDPFENLQAAIYARCITYPEVPKKDSFPILVHIYQPRSRDAGDEPFKIWETTWGDIRERGNRIRKIADNILRIGKGDAPVFAPSDKACQWCPAKGFCTARGRELTKGIEALAVIEPGPKALPLVTTLPVEQRVAIQEHGAEIIKWLNDAMSYNADFLKNGGKLPGFKLVLSRGGNRYWSNPKLAAKLILDSSVLREDEVYEKKIIGPAAAEKLLGKRKFSAGVMNLITRPPGVPVIAPESDKREEYGADLGKEFSNLDDF